MNKARSAMKKHTKAFTIIELVAGIVIAAVLITILLPKIIASAREARHKACRGQIAIINEQVELYYTRTGEWPRADLMDLVWDTDTFPDGMPSCPVTGYFYWLYEDTHRLGGHDENNPESHKKLGYVTAGDYTLDSQGFLAGKVVRRYDAEGGHYELIRYGDYKRELMEDGVTWRVVGYTMYYYNAYGSLVAQHDRYDVEYELVDGVYKEMGYKTRVEGRRGQILKEVYAKLFYDNEGIDRCDYTETTNYYPFSEGQIVMTKDKRDYHFDLDAGRYTGITATSWDAGNNKLGGVELTYDAYYGMDHEKYPGQLSTKTMTYTDGSEPPKVLAVHNFTEIAYQEGTRRETGWTLDVVDGAGAAVGRIVYTTGGSDAEGLPEGNNWKFYDPTDLVNPIEVKHTKQPPGIKWDYELNKRDTYALTTTTTIGGLENVETKGYNIQYDDYGRETFIKYAFRDENNLLKGTKECSNYIYEDGGKGLLSSVKVISKRPNGDITMDRDVTYDNYDDAGRLTAWSTEDNYADGRKVKLEISRTYEGTDTVTSNRRKATDLITGAVKYDYELTNIKRKINGDYSSYTWENKLTGETGTWFPPDPSPLPW